MKGTGATTKRNPVTTVFGDRGIPGSGVPPPLPDGTATALQEKPARLPGLATTLTDLGQDERRISACTAEQCSGLPIMGRTGHHGSGSRFMNWRAERTMRHDSGRCLQAHPRVADDIGDPVGSGRRRVKPVPVDRTPAFACGDLA